MKRAGLFIIHLAVGADRGKRKTPPIPPVVLFVLED